MMAPMLEQKGETMKLFRDLALLLATPFPEEGMHNSEKLWGLFFFFVFSRTHWMEWGTYFFGTVTCYCAVNMTNKSHQEEPISCLFKIKRAHVVE